MQKAYISKHVEDVLNSKHGIDLLVQVVTQQREIARGNEVVCTAGDKTFKVRGTSALVDPKKQP